jgi:spore germination protein
MVCALALVLASAPKVSAWIVGHNPNSLATFRKQAKSINTVFMEYYAVDKNARVTRRASYTPVFRQARTVARKNGVEFYIMISNYATDAQPEGFEATRLTKMVATKESITQSVKDLVKLIVEDQADGVDLDLESMVASDRDRYSAFVVELSKALKVAKRKLSVTVHPKTDDVGSWDGPKAQDYKALGSVADQFNVMTYDVHWAGSEPGAIAPTDWVEQVMLYTKSRVSASKIAMGIPCYGYDWNQKPATSLVWDDFAKHKYTVDDSSHEYVDGKVFFGGSKSFETKYKLAKKLGIGGVAFWYCGSEEPAIWSLLPRRK